MIPALLSLAAGLAIGALFIALAGVAEQVHDDIRDDLK